MVFPNDDENVPSNGNVPTFQPGKPNASTHDIIIGESRRDAGSHYFDGLQALAVGSTDPATLLPLARNTPRDVARLKRLCAKQNVIYAGQTHMPKVMLVGMLAKIGVNGEGRKEVLRGMGARREERLAQGRGYQAMYDRFNDNGPSGNGRLSS